MSTYPPIADHGLIGDLQTAALVATNGTVDWFCCPRFDSPSIFASLLDHEKGGRFTLHPLDTECVSKQMYLPDTAVLVTRFLSEKGVVEVIDFMPIEKPGSRPTTTAWPAPFAASGESSTSRLASSRDSTTGASPTRRRSTARTRCSKRRR